MAPRRAALLVLALLLAGCLQEAPAPAAGEETLVEVPPLDLVDTLPPPAPLDESLLPPPPRNETPPPEPENWTVEPPTPDPQGEAIVLYRSAGEADASSSALIDVPEGTLRLRLALETNTSAWSGVVELRSPDGATMAACLGAPCETAVDGPVVEGRWELRFPAGAAREIAILLVAIVDEAEEKAPAPLPEPVLVEATQRVLYKHVRQFGDSGLNRTFTDTFAVTPGYGRLAVKVHTGEPIAAGQVRMLVLDPSWKVVGSCDASEERCVIETTKPTPGLWRINYTGDARVRSEIVAWGLAVDDVPLPANMTAQDTRHPYTLQPGGNASGGFYVVSGYGRMRLDISFDHPLPITGTDNPRIYLYDPAGRAWACAPGPDYARCPREVPAVEGRWYAYYFGPASGSVTIRAHLAPGAPQADPEPPAQEEPILPTQFYMRDVRYAGVTNRTDWINVYSTAARLTGFLYVDVEKSVDTPSPVVRLYNPGGVIVAECVGHGRTACPVNVSATWSGRWHVHFSGDGRGYARASLNYSDEASYRPSAGHYHTAYDTTHAFYSWPDRAFAEGFTMLPGWSRVNVTIEFVKVAADDGTATASIEVREPGGGTKHVCSRQDGVRGCTFEMAARDGLWEVGYAGRDPSSYARVSIRVHG